LGELLKSFISSVQSGKANELHWIAGTQIAIMGKVKYEKK
jgi:hypothetical protein